MTRIPWILAWRHLISHPARTVLTLGATFLALLLFCVVGSISSSMSAAVSQAASNRVMTQSAVSLFVSLPLDYEGKIAAIPGAEAVSKFQWFGGYYKDPQNFFAQFGVDHERFFDMYSRDMRVIEGPDGVTGDAARDAVLAALRGDRRAAIIGQGLRRDFGWKVGSTVPLTGTIFQKDEAWEFNIVGVYEALKSNVDDRTLFFRFDYLSETLFEGAATGPNGVGVYVTNVAPGHDPAAVIAGIDGLFANGPQATRTSSEAAFQAGFVSMMGNLPLFIGTIGGAVVFAVMFSVINTMLISWRQRTRETGILKAIGFSDGALAGLLVGESLLLALLGGGAGCLSAYYLAMPMRRILGTMIPNFAVLPETVAVGLGVSAAIGILAAVVPSFQALRLRPTQALRSEG